ncbi:hypothetical protein QBC32DRAFT_344597 [Pseudoneurospora amorphoporcata]|uniref:Secreted protein n=1 Tax=Pseudoneurospora amorphoporcata TaxID=241081 RepID=A0AAN6NSU3_9PEZI|nr:hypothetical protein QBC32DRAFT_344597 [Pseudoneurospora amorphoporcata]
MNSFLSLFSFSYIVTSHSLVVGGKTGFGYNVFVRSRGSIAKAVGGWMFVGYDVRSCLCCVSESASKLLDW